VNIGERDNHALVGGEVHPGNTSHLVLHAPQEVAGRLPPISSRFQYDNRIIDDETAKSPVGAHCNAADRTTLAIIE
jgi:hypothetical protein